MTYADAIRTAIVDEAGAMAFIAALTDADKVFHFEDCPHTIPCFSHDEATLLKARVDEMYGLAIWTNDDCPCGRALEIQAQRAGFPSWEAMRDSQ